MFFVTFVMFTKLVLLNVVVAILMVQVTMNHYSSLHHVLSCEYTSLTPSLVACDGGLVTDDRAWQLNVASEEVLLELLRDQSLRLEELGKDEDNEDLLEELGLEKERKMDNFQSDIMKEKAVRDQENKDKVDKNRDVVAKALAKHDEPGAEGAGKASPILRGKA